jgi:hypothetical protein
MRFVLMSLLGFVLAANGLFMLVDPAAWYALVPGVPETGPLNPHFVRDIGCAYSVAGAALIGNAFDERLRAAALAGALFLTFHALVHVADAVAGREHADHALAELVTIFVPAVIALWLVLSSNTRRTHNVQVADEAADRRV